MSEQTLEERVFKCMEEILQGTCKTHEENIMKSVEERFQIKEQQINATLNKGLGLESDPVARMSDLISHGRKASLEKAETAKRTPAPETPAGPDGNTQPNPIDDMFAKAKRGELPA
jgi:hypothetical protein